MDQDQEEFIVLRDRAREALVRGFPPERRALCDLQLIVMPFFGNWESFELYGRPSTLVKATWRQDLDAEKFRNPVERLRHARRLDPTIEIVSTDVAQELVSSTRDELSRLNIPAHPGPPGIVLDGTGYQLTIGGGTAVCHWNDLAPGLWSPLQAWALRWIERVRSYS